MPGLQSKPRRVLPVPRWMAAAACSGGRNELTSPPPAVPLGVRAPAAGPVLEPGAAGPPAFTAAPGTAAAPPVTLPVPDASDVPSGSPELGPPFVPAASTPRSCEPGAMDGNWVRTM